MSTIFPSAHFLEGIRPSPPPIVQPQYPFLKMALVILSGSNFSEFSLNDFGSAFLGYIKMWQMGVCGL